MGPAHGLQRPSAKTPPIRPRVAIGRIARIARIAGLALIAGIARLGAVVLIVRIAGVVASLAIAACASLPPSPGPNAAAPAATAMTAPRATPADPSGGEVVARGERFVIVRPGATDTLRSIARRFLGSDDEAWRIAEFNGVAQAEAGQPLVVPLQPLNPLGVQADQVQTVPILCYHRFGAGGGKMVVSPAAFAAQLDWLAQNDFHVLRLADLAAYLDGRRALPRRSVVITIDDGYESIHRVALPLLKRHGFPATVFLYSDFIGAGDALSWAQLQDLVASGLIDIGAHSKSHRNLLERAAGEGDAPYRQGLEAEARVPREVLEKRLGVSVRDYAFPYGDANAAVLDVLGRQQYRLAVTVNPGGNAFFAQPLMLRRTMILGDQDLEAFKARLQTSRPIGGA